MDANIFTKIIQYNLKKDFFDISFVLF